MSMATGRPAVAQAIEIRVDDIAQLFHTLDPFPFREKDLDTDAEEYIVSSARELAPDQPPKIIVHLPAAQASTSGARDIGAALARHFDHRAQLSSLELKHLFRLGRRALAIGLGVLFLSVIAAQIAAASLAPRPLGRVIEESFIIFGWVANWRPIEVFLYDWWPIARQRKLYERLAAARVELKPYDR